MSGFSAEWLTLREPHDRRARNPAVLDALARAFAGRDAIAVVDLGCGTGATLRAVSELLPRRQSWRLLDRDLALLAAASTAASASLALSAEIAIATEVVDLARGLEAALDGNGHLVTMSALLDLVSATWLDRLAGAVARRKVPL